MSAVASSIVSWTIAANAPGVGLALGPQCFGMLRVKRIRPDAAARKRCAVDAAIFAILQLAHKILL